MTPEEEKQVNEVFAQLLAEEFATTISQFMCEKALKAACVKLPTHWTDEQSELLLTKDRLESYANTTVDMTW